MPSPPHRPATLSPFNRPSSASSSSLPPPLPSPSLSPSINSLLNSRTTQEYFPPSFGVGPGDAARAAAAFFSEEAAEPEPQPLQQKQQQVTREASRPLSANADPGTVFSSSSSSSNGRERSSTPSQHHHNNNPGASSSSSSSSAQQHLSAAEPPRKRSRPPSSEQETDMMPPPPSRVASGSPKRVATAPLAPPPPPARDPNAIEPSIFNVEPIDEFTKEVADWLWGFCSGLDPEVVEIEAKIGILLDTRSRGRERYHLPVPIETILTDDTGLRFESNMTINQHKAYNSLLNSLVESTASPSHTSLPVRYAHTRELDSFHPHSSGDRSRKVRVTRDAKADSSAKPLRVVEKTRIADMNIFSPKRMFDWRISVSVEQPAPLPSSPPTLQRHKDRISYTHQFFTVDLTQVSTGSAPPGGAGALHELEVEFRDARQLLAEKRKGTEEGEGRYLEMVQALLNNVRMLIRNASDP